MTHFVIVGFLYVHHSHSHFIDLYFAHLLNDDDTFFPLVSEAFNS